MYKVGDVLRGCGEWYVVTKLTPKAVVFNRLAETVVLHGCTHHSKPDKDGNLKIGNALIRKACDIMERNNSA
jgi:hypothetical protein